MSRGPHLHSAPRHFLPLQMSRTHLLPANRTRLRTHARHNHERIQEGGRQNERGRSIRPPSSRPVRSLQAQNSRSHQMKARWQKVYKSPAMFEWSTTLQPSGNRIRLVKWDDGHLTFIFRNRYYQSNSSVSLSRQAAIAFAEKTLSVLRRSRK